MLKKFWIAYLGIFFMFLSGLYFLKVAFNAQMIPPIGIVAIGLVIGLSGLISGYSLHRKGTGIIAEVIAGFGTGIIYATLIYAGFSPRVNWSTNAVLISMIANTALVGWIGYQFHMRVLTNLAVVGGLLTPIVLKAGASQVPLLFFYVLILNVVAIVFSVVKNWRELRIVGFVMTLVTYFVYYLYFQPLDWVEPFRYIFTFFFVYAIGLVFASWKDRDQFEGLNLYLGLLNAINFVFWSIIIFNRAGLSTAIPLLIVGVMFMVGAGIIFRLTGKPNLAVMAYLFLGVVLTGIAGSDFGDYFQTPGLHHVVRCSVWLGLAMMIYTIGYKTKNTAMAAIGMLGWVYLFFHWYSVAWGVKWVAWFGLPYIPFINPGALLWIALAVTGFIISRLLIANSDHEVGQFPTDAVQFGSLSFAILSHVVIGGLLTLQIQNAWDVYHIHVVSIELALSLVWGIYAMLLFLWGSFSRLVVFRWLGSFVLIFVSSKVLFVDLSGEATFYKAGFLFLMGLITMGIFGINYYWSSTEEKELPDHSETKTHIPATDMAEAQA